MHCIVFENNSKPLILQNCEQSERNLRGLVNDVISLNTLENVNKCRKTLHNNF